MLDYDPVTSLNHYPGAPMARFGLTPYGQPLYRIVFAPSRRHLVCGVWPDGTDRAQYVKRYPQVGDQWIMERWLSAMEYTKGQPWDLTLGPFPERGEYDLCHEFQGLPPVDTSLDTLVAMIEKKRDRRLYDAIQWHRADAEREKRDVSNIQEAAIRDAMPAFRWRPMSGYGGGRGTKTPPVVHSAEELGLPTQGGQRRSRIPRNQPKFEIPLGV